MNFMTKWALALVPGLALATPALALAPVNQADLAQPGSVIIFPKILNLPAVTVDGQTMPRSEIEVGAVCPVGITCTEHQTVKVRFHWVCPAVENVNSNICKETDFDLFLSIDGKLAFPADGSTGVLANQPRVPAPPCPRGYLIGSVVNPADQLIKFDGLIGNAVIRNPNISSGSSTGLSAYSALGIQADPALATGALINTAGQLFFDGLPGHYTMVTGEFVGDVKFDKTAAGAPLPNVLSQTFITFLTLDVRSNQPNNPTFVPLQFSNESLATVSTTNPLFETVTSTSHEFVCWDQVQLSTINTNLTQVFQGTRKGIVRAGPAIKVENGAPDDDIGPVTLLALIETIEGTAANSFLERKYNFSVGPFGPPVLGGRFCGFNPAFSFCPPNVSAVTCIPFVGGGGHCSCDTQTECGCVGLFCTFTGPDSFDADCSEGAFEMAKSLCIQRPR
jgi:hypothetical protein